MFTEIERDCGGTRRENANLSDWAAAGVLMLNRVLTTPPRQAGGHRRKGWEAITAAIVNALAARDTPLVVILWGNDAIKLAAQFPQRADCRILTSGHPSPLAYNRPSSSSFKACGHFAAANQHLSDHHLTPINWSGI
jgi:uracil-DNA glycosylase